jgi:molybdopterin biosynthesis enzyme
MNNQQTDCECDTTPQALLSIDEALELLLNSAKVTRSTQWLGLDDALNKILT